MNQKELQILTIKNRIRKLKARTNKNNSNIVSCLEKQLSKLINE